MELKEVAGARQDEWAALIMVSIFDVHEWQNRAKNRWLYFGGEVAQPL